VLILALDTSGDTCLAVVAEMRNIFAILSEHRFLHERRLSERLPSVVEFALKDARVTLRDIDAFVVGIGPGSFTGVRVGVTMAKTWAMALQKPVYGVSSFDALAYPLVETLPESFVATVAPTGRGIVVGAFYRGGQAPVRPPAVLAAADVPRLAREALARDPSALDNDVLLCGEAARSVQAAVTPTQAVHVFGEAISARALLMCAVRRLQAGEPDDTDALTPLYVTPSPVG